MGLVHSTEGQATNQKADEEARWPAVNAVLLSVFFSCQLLGSRAGELSVVLPTTHLFTVCQLSESGRPLPHVDQRRGQARQSQLSQDSETAIGSCIVLRMSPRVHTHLRRLPLSSACALNRCMYCTVRSLCNVQGNVLETFPKQTEVDEDRTGVRNPKFAEAEEAGIDALNVARLCFTVQSHATILKGTVSTRLSENLVHLVAHRRFQANHVLLESVGKSNVGRWRGAGARFVPRSGCYPHLEPICGYLGHPAHAKYPSVGLYFTPPNPGRVGVSRPITPDHALITPLLGT